MAYVYGHYKADTGELFYIGKGTGNRAWSRNSRNLYWKHVVAKHGLHVSILEDGLTDDEAFEREKHIIEEIGLDKLANIHEGGKGFTSEQAKKLVDTPEQRKRLSEQVKRTHKTDKWKAAVTKANKKLATTDVWKENHRKGNKDKIRRWKDNPELKDQATSYAQDPNWKRNVSEGLRRKWQDPEYRAQQLARRKP